MSHSRDERSPSPNGSASPGNRRHRSRSRSRSPPRAPGHQSRSRSRSPPRAARRSRSRSPEEDATNPGNNLYVTGLSTRVTSSDLEKFFSKEGKVVNCSLVTDPHTKESRGFAFVTMGTAEEAERCIKYLNRTVLEGRLVTVEKAKRARGRTPTPGRYQGQRERRGGRGQRRSRSYSPKRRYDSHRDRPIYDHRDQYPRERRARSRSPIRRRADDYSNSYRRA